MHHRVIIASCAAIVVFGGIAAPLWLQQMHESCTGEAAHQVVCSIAFLADGSVPLLVSGALALVLMLIAAFGASTRQLPAPCALAWPPPRARALTPIVLTLFTRLFRRGILHGRIP